MSTSASSQNNLPLHCAIAIGSLHLALAVRMSLFRISLHASKDKEKDENKEEEKKKVATSFEIAHRTQLNVAEYSGLFLPMLLYIQYAINTSKPKPLSNIGFYSCYLTVLGSYIFALGFATVKDLKSTNSLKFIGAITRYVSAAGLLYQLYLFTK